MQGWPTTQLEKQFQLYCRRKAKLSVLEGCMLWGSTYIYEPPDIYFGTYTYMAGMV